MTSITLPLWTIPIPVIAAAVIDWTIETYRKFAAGRSRPRRPLSRDRIGGDIPRVTVLRRTGDRP